MNAEDPMIPGGPVIRSLRALHNNWVWFFVLGIALIVCGTIALGMPLVATFSTVIFVGYLLFVSGIFEIVSSFWARNWSGFGWHLLSGILHAIVGVFVIERPGLSAAGITLVIAVFLIVGGVFRIVFALMERFPQWGWVFASGAVSLLLGIMIWRQWPEATVWVVGTFVGVDLILAGWSWVMLALAARRIPTLG